MNYKSELQNNNLDLQGLIDKANTLPDAKPGLDTSDATAAASDLVVDKTAYVNGEKITGTIPEIIAGDSYNDYNSTNEIFEGLGKLAIEIVTPVLDDVILRKDSNIYTTIEADKMEPFGNATASQVLSGKVFTSSSGFRKVGTHVCAAGTDTSDATAVASDIMSGKTAYINGGKVTGTHVCAAGTDTSDATAVASDILSGKTAYVNGYKTTGTLVVNSYYVGAETPNNSFGNDGDLYLVRGE